MPTLLTPPVVDPTIEAATRRQFLTGLAAAGLLTGCTGPEASAPNPPITRTITTALGPVGTPTDPRRVITLDAQSLEFALTLGVPVISSYVPPTPGRRPALAARRRPAAGRALVDSLSTALSLPACDRMPA